MAFDLIGISHFMREAAHADFHGKKLLTLGKLGICMTITQMYDFAERMGVKLPFQSYDQFKSMDNDRLDMYDFFKAFGFSEVHAMDISSYEGADIVFDLNSSAPPPEYVGYFDYIIDGGTTEHVFNVPNALSNTLAMLKVGGKIVQGLPANNWMEHGYYQFSPSLLVGFYSSNGCHVDEATLFFSSKNYTMSGCKLVDGFSTCFSLGVDARLYDYENRFNCYSVPILGDYTVNVRVVAIKTNDVESVQAPLQSYWFDSGSEYRWGLTVKALGLDQYQQNEIVVWGTGVTAERLLDTLAKCNNFKKSSVLGVVNTYNDCMGQLVNGTFKVVDNSQAWSESVKCIIIAARYHEQEIYEAVCDRANEHGIRLVRLAKHLYL